MYGDGYMVHGYTIMDICLWRYNYIHMVTMYSYFDIRWTEPIQDNLDVIDMWLWIYIYGILSRIGNQNSKYSRVLPSYHPSTKLNIHCESIHVVFWEWNGNENIPEYSKLFHDITERYSGYVLSLFTYYMKNWIEIV